MAKNIRKGITSLHGFFNDSVYGLLSQYKNAQPHLSEIGVTCHLLNLLSSKQSKKIKYFGKIGPESFTGSDLLLVLRGTYYGSKKELRILYQAKLTDWIQNEPYIFADNRVKHNGVEFQNKLRSDRFEAQLKKYEIDLNKRKIIRNNYDMFQHDCLLSFARAVEAEPLYLLYRYNYQKKIKKNKAVGFLFARIIKDLIDKNQTFSIHEDKLGDALFFHNSLGAYKAIIENLRNDSGFYFFQSNLEATYANYVALFEKGCATHDFLDFKPVKLHDQDSGLRLLSVNEDSSLKNIYVRDEKLFHLEYNNDLAHKVEDSSPCGICIVELD